MVGGPYRPELKWYYKQVNAHTFTTGVGVIDGSVTAGITQGTNVHQRQGNIIYVKRIDVRMVFGQISQADMNANGIYRVLFVLDKQCNGVASVQNALDDIETVNLDYIAFNDLPDSHRFKILKNVFWECNPQGAEGNGTTHNSLGLSKLCQFSLRFPGRGMPFKYATSTANVADLTTNNIGIIGVGSSTTATVRYALRVRFCD